MHLFSSLVADVLYCISTLEAPYYIFKILTHLKLCVATATDNLKWGKNTYICCITFKSVINLTDLTHNLHLKLLN